MVKKQKIVLIIFILICSFFQVIPVIKSGLNYDFGIGFWGPNGHDGIWHLSLINHISNPFKIPIPTFSGEYLRNYHPFFDILVSFLSFTTRLPPSLLLFQVVPCLMAISFSVLSYQVGFRLTQRRLGGFLLLFLNTFANSFGWVVTLVRNHQIGGESLFWAMQSFSNQLNPPYMLSLLFLLALILILIQTKRLSKLHLFIIFVLLTLTPITKAYASVPIFLIVASASISSFLKKDYRLIIVTFLSLISGMALFFVFNPKPSGLLVYQPFWFINSMIESPDRLFIPKLASARYNLELSNIFSLKLILIYLVSFSIFFIGNFAWRALAVFSIRKNSSLFVYSLYLTTIVLILIPTFFIQKATSWNTIQFLYYALFIGNILLAYTISQIKNIKILYTVVLLIASTSFISNINSYREYLSPTPSSYITPQETICLKNLSDLKPGTVLSFPYDPYLRNSQSSIHGLSLYVYETTSYISAYTPHFVYVDDTMNLNNSGYDWKTRLDASTQFFKQKDKNQDRGFLVNNKIDYIYLPASQLDLKLDKENLYISEIFKNTACRIYQVQR